MDARSSTRSPDRTISELAGRQHGVVARRQLIQAGLSATMIGRRLQQGRLHQVRRGVYLVGHAVPPHYALEMAALLACAPGAILSHRSAAALWGLLPYPPPADVCVTVPPWQSAGRPGLAIHRVTIDRRDVRHRQRMPLTSPPRTLLDLAAVNERGTRQPAVESARLSDLERIVAKAQYRGLASEAELHDQLQRTRASPVFERSGQFSASPADYSGPGRPPSESC